ncbi:MAG: hypothetical protein HFE28_07905 [Clostridia bacterium]|nr:hypothetical protein [Clostridia bacterium]
MLNENPKSKKKDTAHPTKGQLFWRVQRECWRRMITPFLMYMFMSLISLTVSSMLMQDANMTKYVISIIVDVVCVLCGAAFNAHLCFNYGKMHYDAYITGCLHRKNELFGIPSGGNHRPEKEYRPWKGFLIGFLVGVPVILLGGFGHISNWVAIILFLLAWWAYVPASWAAHYHTAILKIEGYTVSTLFALPMIVLPVLVSGVFYIVGAYVNKRNRAAGKLTKAEEALRR